MLKLRERAMDTKEYLDYIEEQPFCLVCNRKPEPHHLEAIQMGGDKRRQTIKDYSSVNLCRLHHSEVGTIGKSKFEQKYKINLWQEAFKLLRGYFVK